MFPSTIQRCGKTEPGHNRVFLRAMLLCAIMHIPTAAMAGGVPAASGPVCVPYPGMPCPGSVSSSSSGSRSAGSRSTGSRPSTNAIFLNEFQKTLNSMTTPNPATVQRIKQTQMEGDRARQEDVTSQQSSEEQRRQQAQKDAEAARERQLQDLSGRLKILPDNPDSSIDLRPGGTDFFGQKAKGGSKLRPGANIEGWRERASSGFDTRGPIAGQVPAAPPDPSPPSRVKLKEKPIPLDRITPEMRDAIQKRQELRAHKKEVQESLKHYESKPTLTPKESETLEKLKQDLAVTLNKENYLTFTINESLP